MPRCVPSLLAGLWLVLAASSGGWAQDVPDRPGPPMDAARLEALMDRLASVSEREVAFREEKTLSALEDPLVSTGTLLYRRPDHLEKRTLQPAREDLVVDGDRLRIKLGDEPERTLDLAAQPELGALIDTIRGTLAGDLDLLRRSYTVAGESGPDGWRLVLTPTDRRLARFVDRVEIRGADAHPASIDITQANGDRQSITILAAS
ncbi:outer membrane lipoprotein carrier protein LolA [Marinivivus vitaminiproducens]|uniref:outer membrane lipoprotein carrier protein LolA n=1 Tax=Marinivivus vitaminiproducens TaxID=3035935 RepID=UPI0027AB3434|nr:outer membrane lipoprotein carrier protein LolA [Geminicoccaceae bacterium SCSIO 64248]